MGEIRASLRCESDLRVFRNNVGKLQDALGRVVTFGLGVGSPDLVLMFILNGKNGQIAALCGLEVKSRTGKLSAEQVQWHKTAETVGILVKTVRSVDEAVSAVAWMRSELRRRLAL